jgi:AcrR family transcriptional regulator
MSLEVRDQPVDKSRHDILGAAALCFMERGYSAVSIDEVARSLGATKGRIYHYFPSKADLFAEVFRAGMEMNYAAIEPFRHGEGPAARQWLPMARAHVHQMIRTQAVWMGVEMHLRGATTPEQRSVFTELLQYRTDYGLIFRKIIERGRTEGDFRFHDLSISNQLMFMTLNSPIFWYKPRPGQSEADVDAIVEEVVLCAWRGLGAREEMGSNG